MNPEVILKVDRLTKRFGSFEAVKDISFEVRRGELFGFIGANGAGKTTAMRMITGLLRPSEGEAVVAGFAVSSQPEQVKRRIGYMSQRFSLYEDLTVSENIRFFGGVYGLSDLEISERADELISELGMEQMRHAMVRELPLGWKQKLAFGTALLHRPEIVFLDEPTGGVDPVTRRQFWERMYQEAARGTTIFVTTHYMDEAEYCDRVSIMVDGEIRALDTPAALKQQFGADSMDEVFVQLARGAKRGDG
jgi:ABC-2 type transport system ATP-binding protein